MTRAWRGLIGAAAFLTIVPIPSGAPEAFDLSPALPWFPLIGAAVGALGGGVRTGLEPVLGRAPSTVVAIAALVLVTGALHQDALADTFDGLGVRGDRARRLAVMRDSSLGAFGVLALVVWALLLLTSLGELRPGRALLTLVAAEAVARSAAVVHGRVAPATRPDGLGASARFGWPAVLTGALLAAVIAVLAVGPARAGLSVGIALLAGAASAVLARRTIGGSTGDTLGASVALSEVLVCVALAATWR